MKQDTKTIELYHKFRLTKPFMLVGFDAKLSLDAAKTLVEFERLESLGLVRMRCEPEEERYFDVFGKPDAYTNGQGKRVSAEDALKEMVEMLDRDGCWWTVAEWRASENEDWDQADSCGMHAGYKDPLSPFENCYVIQEMQSAIDALQAYREQTAKEQTESEAMACRDILTV